MPACPASGDPFESDKVTHSPELIPRTGDHMGVTVRVAYRRSAPNRRTAQINITSWRIVAALTILSTIAAGLLFATGLKANADSAPTYDGRTGCDLALAGQSHCDIQGS